ncbi:DUF2799 domain-containing protein [Pleionea sediminis]|uniref:DUF2799 domain-containing protein n=1 Tax=Pleionea sediminis TaxID=2569479 RepID=UPI0011851EA5|nr:DUF2799 domain-containing protein [Pleionea sediminis]
MKWALTILSALILGGCANWSSSNTVSTDWYKIGYQEALNGYTANWRNNYHKVVEAPENFDSEQYSKGFKAGKNEQCQQTDCNQKEVLADES